MPKIFCAVPFGQLSTKPNGLLRPCCASENELLLKAPDGNYLNLSHDGLDDAWNSHRVVELRKKFLQNKSDPACHRCLEHERLGKKSTRLWKNESWEEILKTHFREAQKNDGVLENCGPISLELRLGNTCNLSCRSCNPIFSSRWQKELKSNKDWQNNPQLKDGFNSALKESDAQGKWFEKESFWSDIRKQSKSLRSLYLSGGEPLIIPFVKDYLIYLVDNKLSQKIKLRFDTNMMQMGNSIIQILRKFKKVEIGCSIDASGKALEYIRNGAKEQIIFSNFLKLINSNYNFEIALSITYSALNALELFELYEHIFKIENTQKRRSSFNVDILYEPDALSVLNLPKKHREKAANDLIKIIEKFGDKLSHFEVKTLDSIHRYVTTQGPGNVDKLKKYNSFLDSLQGMSLEKYLPKLYEALY